MAFGISFGKNKSTDTKNTNIAKNEATTQSTTGTQNTTTQGTTNTTGSQSGSSTGSSKTGSTTNQNLTQTGATTQTGQTTSFGADVIGALSGPQGLGQLINRILSSDASGGTAMGALGDFDAESFVESTMLAARNTGETNLGEVIRGVTNLIGGNSSENSMSRLLSERATNDTAASLAGVQANAMKTAQEIQMGRAGAISNIGTGEQNALAQVLNAVKGGQTTTTGQTQENQSQATTGGTTSTTNTAEQNQQQNQQMSTQMQEVLQTIQQLMKGTTNMVGIESSVGSSSKSGGGISLGI